MPAAVQQLLPDPGSTAQHPGLYLQGSEHLVMYTHDGVGVDWDRLPAPERMIEHTRPVSAYPLELPPSQGRCTGSRPSSSQRMPLLRL